MTKYQANQNVRVVMGIDKSTAYDFLFDLFPNHCIFPSIPINIFLKDLIKAELEKQFTNYQRNWIYTASCHFVITDPDYFPLYLVDSGSTFNNRDEGYSLFRKKMIALTQLPYFTLPTDHDAVIELAQSLSNPPPQ